MLYSIICQAFVQNDDADADSCAWPPPNAAPFGGRLPPRVEVTNLGPTRSGGLLRTGSSGRLVSGEAFQQFGDERRGRRFAHVRVRLSAMVTMTTTTTTTLVAAAAAVAAAETMAAAGLVLEGSLASTELRAFYGGLEVALGLLMLTCAVRTGRLRDGLILALAIYGSIGLARLGGMLVSGADTPFLRFALATELALAIAATIALRGNRAGAGIRSSAP